MTELTEKEQTQLNTGRLMRAESDLMLPLLAVKERLAVTNIVTAFRSGKYEMLTAYAAELSTLAALRTEITSKIKQAEHIERKIIEGESHE